MELRNSLNLKKRKRIYSKRHRTRQMVMKMKMIRIKKKMKMMDIQKIKEASWLTPRRGLMNIDLRIHT